MQLRTGIKLLANVAKQHGKKYTIAFSLFDEKKGREINTDSKRKKQLPIIKNILCPLYYSNKEHEKKTDNTAADVYILI